MHDHFAYESMSGLAAALDRREISSQELTRLYLSRIDAANSALHAYVNVDQELALALARAADERRANGLVLSVFDGVPFAAKDLCELRGRVTTVGSEAWRDRRSALDCTALMRCLRAGMVLLGKTHMVEFAFGGWGTNPVMGTPRNPWDLDTHRVPGGSSSGSGVAVAAGLAPGAIGSDTGGSVRIPSALNGLTGLKTTRGLISLHGAFALSPTLDTIGPMTHSAEDAAHWLAIMAGPDPLDASSLAHPPFVVPHPKTLAQGKPLQGVRIGVLAPEQYPIAVQAPQRQALDAVAVVLRELGAELTPVSLPFDFRDLMIRNGQIIAAEAFAIHGDYVDDEQLPLGDAVRSRIQSGRAISAADYLDASAHRQQCSAQFAQFMQRFSAVLTPSLGGVALPVTEVDESQTPLAAFFRAGNYLGACALVLPAGLSPEGLPVSVQLLGKGFGEAEVLRIGIEMQRVTTWHQAHPNLQPLGL
jgi:aspartyl-tRNA(Asn)/glutamyl-tRNA(Gln) amidotransferase subunit A